MTLFKKKMFDPELNVSTELPVELFIDRCYNRDLKIRYYERKLTRSSEFGLLTFVLLPFVSMAIIFIVGLLVGSLLRFLPMKLQYVVFGVVSLICIVAWAGPWNPCGGIFEYDYECREVDL